jgi:hypothetical protein
MFAMKRKIFSDDAEAGVFSTLERANGVPMRSGGELPL